MTSWLNPNAKALVRAANDSDPYGVNEAMPLKAGRDLDALVAEKVMGENLTPPRGWALMIVGLTLTSVTGKDWKLRNGKTVYMPNGDDLPQPEGTTDYNARYYAYAAEHSGEDVDALVAKVRNEAMPYSTDIAAAWLVVDRLRSQEYGVILSDVRARFWTCEVDRSDWRGSEVWTGETAPLAICRAALAAEASPRASGSSDRE